LADKKITQLNNITGADLADADEFVVVDITSDETKAITFNELKTAFDTGTGFVRVTGDTMTGALNVESTITADGLIVDGDVTFGDNDKAIFGAGSDLQISHDGNNSLIADVGTGNLHITAQDLRLQSANNQDAIKCIQNGAVTLYYDNASKLATTSTGIDVTGTVTSDGLTVDASGEATLSLNGYTASQNTEVQLVAIREDTSTSKSILDIKTNNGTSLTKRARFDWDGDISFYEDTGTTAKFFWDSSAESLGIGTTSPSSILHINNTADAPNGITIQNSSASGSADSYVQFKTNSANVIMGIDATGTDIFKISNSTALGTSDALAIDSSGNVGIGTSSPNHKLQVLDQLKISSSDQSSGSVMLGDGGSANFKVGIGRWNGSTNAAGAGGVGYFAQGPTNSGGHFFYTGDASAGSTTERMRIDSSGNVGIGESDPDSTLTVKGASHTNFQVKSNSESTKAFIQTVQDSDVRIGSSTNHPVSFYQNGNERMRIDSSGNVGIGTSSPTLPLDIVSNSGADALKIRARPNGNDYGTLTFYNNAGTTKWADIQSNVAKDLRFYTNGGTEAMRIDSSGNVGLNLTSPSEQLSTLGNVNIGNNDSSNPLSYLRFGATQYGAADIRPSDEGGHKVGLDFYTDGTGDVTINPTFAMRIDGSGSVLVGTTNSNPTSSAVNVAGQSFSTTGGVRSTVASNPAATFNRKTDDGAIALFRKDGSTVGSIDASGGNLIVQGTTSAGKTGIKFGGSQWIPQDNGNSDGGVDLGMLSARFNDIYATNGTIQTSDRNEKQDITSLTATEMLVGKRISTLFKTFRWKDSVAEKGDNARTHTGVIAQDVQAAFTAEGLDAVDYALFISSTWWETQTEVPAVEAVAEVTDDDGNVTTEAVEAVDAYTRTDTYEIEDEAPEGATSKTRMGIRYPELLSFVAAYNEQRFASIETRLTALEG
jgi:hypothetical protein